MKKATFIFAALAIMIMANMNVKAICPDGWTEVTGTLYYNGCQYEYTYCYGILNDLHCMSLNDVSVKAPCDSNDYEANARVIKDKILLQIGAYLESVGFFGRPIPECPAGTECLLEVYDAICYNRWYYEDGKYKMYKCDDLLRSCNVTIYYCWEDLGGGNRVLRLYRTGRFYGPPCPLYPPGCRNNCY